MKILALIGEIFDPFAKLVDELHTSDEEKRRLENEIQMARAQMLLASIDYEKEILGRQADIIVAEAKGESWLQRSWRPMTMLFLTGLVGAHWLGVTPPGLSEAQALSLLGLVKLGLGGYVVGRSVEKAAPKIADAFGSKGADNRE